MSLLLAPLPVKTVSSSTYEYSRTAADRANVHARRPWNSYRRILRTWLVGQDLVLAASTAAVVAAFMDAPQALWLLSTNVLLVGIAIFSGSLSEQVLAEAASGWRRVLSALPTTVLITLLVAQVMRLHVPLGATLLAAPLGTVAMILGRAAVKARLRRTRMDGHGLRRALVVVGEGANPILRGLRQHPGDGFLLVGSIASTCTPDADTRMPRVLGSIDELHQIVVDHKVDVVLSVGAVHPDDQIKALRGIEGTDARFVMMSGLASVAAPRIHVLPSAAGWTGAVEVDKRRERRLGKRVCDLLVGSLLTLIALPIIGIAGIAVKVTDGGPMFYTQTRVGKDGQTFKMFKLRSMYVDADARRAAVIAERANAGQGNEVLFKSANDPRITPVGKIIRRLSIDELPQIFNVLLGDMSLIGPRPALPEEVATYDAEARRRLLVRPGMTGLWQVSGRSDLSWERSVAIDQHYVDNSSSLLDVHITAATFGAVLGGKGAY
ncbi:Putative colanic biosynthesis UDP-glucose lipid carrier transferase [Actinomyces bovis]|uniref:Colanic biosynthesis UDP-glucose lipid carrier transferase n=1 Tax=Actinomyces bovis TaxID=1658 RepID=A0ABY1VLZ4_9ACTO|nr:sugar transferase [Actinomyces bovis]SPT53129.1 Putative colanic biosynthesis UDP-glucose lipid carrier transferase [Actinomyces bovis]VEG52280.1 Putative colanic biosynthesis UDP-glucose lipid carrier transferase [Actinomyces israelii]